jgi:hypothetical protein
MAAVSRFPAGASIGRLRLAGFVAWLIRLVVQPRRWSGCATVS